MQEVVIISGKGGTGKTSVAASFAVLADRPVIADCDVDAADLHLLFTPRVKERHDFYSGHEAIIRQDACTGCGVCFRLCRFGAIVPIMNRDGERRYFVDPVSCEGCGVCDRFCPEEAIDFPERPCGEWMRSETDYGPMVHARLGVAAENSGKLVATVRQEARRLASEGKHDCVIIDGPPGIGCPVIASITGADLTLVVIEPTRSGAHDLERVLDLTRHFGIPGLVCVNKWDINPEMTDRIEKKAREMGAQVVGRIRYDPEVTTAQIKGKTVVQAKAPSAGDIKRLWKSVTKCQSEW